MNRATFCALALLALAAIAPVTASARGLGVELWTDRGQDAVYQPGEGVQVKARASDDAYLLVYEIDTEGYIHLLFPQRGGRGYIEGRQTYRLPEDGARDELVIEGPTGEGHLVAIASRDPFETLPWYLRPYDPRAAEVGYIGRADDDEGVTSEGRIVGDPFVAMERIRRQVLRSPEDRDEFATAYTTYYVHQRVRYPRYMCYDCHRPRHWQWWAGFDPYYTSCSVFDFRVNWGWYWGPSYWFGCMPYYVYVVRYDCPPRYRPNVGWCYSGWDGWPRWSALWSGRLTRYKSDVPPGYVPPSKYGWEMRRPGATPMPARPAPPGFLASADPRGKRRAVAPLPLRKPAEEQPIVPRTDWLPGGELKKPAAGRVPARGPAGEEWTRRGRLDRPGVERGSSGDLRPRREPAGGESPRIERSSPERPAPRESPRIERSSPERPAPRESPRIERSSPERPAPRESPRIERSSPERPAPRESPRIERSAPPPREEKPREEKPREERGGEKGRGR